MATLEGWRLIRKVERVLLLGLFLTPAASLVDYFVISLPRGVVQVCVTVSLMCVSIIMARVANIWEREPVGGCMRGLSEEEKQRLGVGQNRRR